MLHTYIDNNGIKIASFNNAINGINKTIRYEYRKDKDKMFLVRYIDKICSFDDEVIRDNSTEWEIYDSFLDKISNIDMINDTKFFFNVDEHPFLNIDKWVYLFKKEYPDFKYSDTSEEIMIYRGYEKEEYKYGLSWSLDKRVAESFGEQVVQKKIAKNSSKILYFYDNIEKELIIDWSGDKVT